MQASRIIAALAALYMLFAMLLNSVGTVILQSVHTFGIDKRDASVLEAFKDLPIAVVSFLVASFLPRVGYRYSMMIAAGAVAIACAGMPIFKSLWMVKVLFVTVGASFALAKVSVYSSVGLLTHDRQRHASLTNAIEGMFMVGVLASYWVFGAFITPDGDEWLKAYWVLAAFAAVVVALLAIARLDEHEAAPPEASAAQSFAEMLKLMALPLVIVFLGCAFLYVLIEQSIGTWLPTFNNEILKLPHALSVQMASLFAAGLAAGRLGAGLALRYVSWFTLLVICVLGMATLIVLALPLARGATMPPDGGWAQAPLAAYLVPMIGLFMAPIYPAINSLLLSALPKTRHAAMTGLIVIFSALGGTFGSFVTGQVFARFGGQQAFYLALVPMALLLAMLVQFRVRLAHQARVA